MVITGHPPMRNLLEVFCTPNKQDVRAYYLCAKKDELLALARTDGSNDADNVHTRHPHVSALFSFSAFAVRLLLVPPNF